MRRSLFVALVATLAITACGGSHNGPLPTVPGGHQAPPTGSHGTATLSITIPKAAAPAAGTKHPAFVSPATTQMIVDIQQSAVSIGGYPQTVALTPTSNGCSSTLANTFCQLQIALSPGSYTISVTLEDAGNTVLSQTTNFPFTIVEGTANSINMTLGGVATALVVVPLSTHRLKGGTSGLTAYGNYAQNFAVVPVDADGNFIVGPGAPTASASLESGAYASLQTPAPTSPQTFTLVPSYGAPDPSIPAPDTIDVTATPVPDSGGSTLSLSVPLTIYQPWIYLLTFDNVSTAAITATDEAGNPVSGGYSRGVLANMASQIYGMTYGDGLLYVDGGQGGNNNEVSSYPLIGNPAFADADNGLTGVGNPLYAGPIVFDENNHSVYFGDSGFTGQAVGLSADLSLVEVTGAPGDSGQYGAIVDPADGHIVFTGAGGNFLNCDPSLTCNQYSPNNGAFFEIGMAYDPDAKRVGANVLTSGDQTQLFDFSGAAYGSQSLPSSGTALAYDPYATTWIAAWGASDCSAAPNCGVTSFNETLSGAATNAPDFSSWLPNSTSVRGIVVVP